MRSPTLPKKPLNSPLRYPGGKSGLFRLVSELVRMNGAAGGTYVEPYAGGAGIALGLLFSEQVERIVLNDLDPAIASFWRAVTEDPSGFMTRIEAAELSVAEWQRQRTVYLCADTSDPVSLGFAAFYLNRTNRSGVLTGGVIGGQDQCGNYKIGARFNKSALIERCRLIGLYSPRIRVMCRDGLDVIEEHVEAERTFVYADPPYFEKGSRLYLNSFDRAAHSALAEHLNARSRATWLLTYDHQEEISDLYRQRRQFLISINYSARNVRRAQELLIPSDSLLVPDSLARVSA